MEKPMGHKVQMESSLQEIKQYAHVDMRWHCSTLLVQLLDLQSSVQFLSFFMDSSIFFMDITDKYFQL